MENNAIAVKQQRYSPEEEELLFRRVPLDQEESEHLAAEPYSYWKSVFRVFVRKPAAIIGVIGLLIMILGIIIIPQFAPATATKTDITIRHLAPSAEHWFGTDVVGRDLFYCCWIGLKKSLVLALIATAIDIGLGTIVGLIWGYFRRLDPILIELYNLVSNIPSLLFYMLLSFVIASAFPKVPVEARLIVSLTLFGWIGVALFIRNQTLIINNREYNVASKTLGTPPMRIMFRNLLPYLLPVIITDLSLTIPGMISGEVSLSYFGVGLPSASVSIGAILELGRLQFETRPWEFFAPAGMLAFVIFVFYLIGLAFSDALDPKKHR